MRLGDLDALYKVIEELSKGAGFYKPIYDGFLNCIKMFPAIDAAPVVCGRWDGTADGYYDGELVYDMWNCSNCGFDADGADEKPDWNYCPHCGAKMNLEGGGSADNHD